MTGTGVVKPNRIAFRRARRAVGIGPMLLASLSLLLIGWTLLWLFARHQAYSSFDQWIAAERGQGRYWSCPNRAISGFPLSIRIRCDHPTYADRPENGTVRGELTGLAAEAHLYFPSNIIVDLAGPLTFHEQSTATDFTVVWSQAHVTLRGDMPGDFNRGQLQADAVAVTPAGSSTPTTIDHLDLSIRPFSEKAGASVDAEAILKLSGARSPDADAAFGSSEPMAASATALATRLPSEGASLPLLLEPWRRAGGQLHLEAFSLTKGAFSATGDGHIELDEEHRLAGRLDSRFAGLEPIAARFGIPVGAVKLGAVLSGLLGGKTDKADARSAELTFSLVAKNGRLYVGPVRTDLTLPPVY